MTTTTAEHTDEETLVDAAARAATEAQAKSLATIEPEQQRFNDQQVAILRQLGIEDASQGDLDLFFHYCRTTGLDPFRRQIYMIGRRTKVKEWNPNTRSQDEKWVMKYTIQTGIDGYRRNGREAAKRLGDELRFDGPYWCGDDGEWKEVWPASTPPTAAKYTIYRNGEPFSAVVHYDEFVQTNAIYEGRGDNRRKVGEEPNSMWAKMPRNQIAKCAEAMAWRRAYPDDFSGIDLEDAAQPTVIDQDGNVESGPAPEPKKRRGGRGVDALRKQKADAAAKAEAPQPEVIDAESEPAPGTEPEATPDPVAAAPAGEKPEKTPMRKAVEKRLFRLIGDIKKQLGEGLTDDERYALYNYVLERTDITSTDQLDNVQVAKVCDALFQWGQDGTLAEEINEVRNLAAIGKAQADEENQ
ncbi:recombinase RecT [Mycolicibacterium goodii]|uniref:recombinase RecT n=1 Tax=Mycolicibacterium goodii TaxID=134601 RepID=UPI001BDC673F|nr:recombinase RecT [Mycolicibacterium goodii]MBU8834158.1 recombinase RecT [Mycolicibacterium goodii]